MVKKDKDAAIDSALKAAASAEPANSAAEPDVLPGTLLETLSPPEVTVINTAPVESARKPKDWEPAHVHVRKVTFDSVAIMPAGDKWGVIVGIVDADDARAFYDSINSLLEHPAEPEQREDDNT